MRWRWFVLRAAFELPERNPNPVFVVSPTGEVAYTNEAAAAILREWRAGSRTRLDEDWRGMLDRAQAPEGHEALVAGRWYRFQAVETETMLNVYGLDVTERRAAEDALRESQPLAQLGVLAAGVAHDFNNVLAAVVGCAELLVRAPLSGEERACAEGIRDICDRATWLTRQLLATSGPLVLRPVVVDLTDLVRRCEPLVRRLAPAGVHVAIESPPGPVEAYADESALFQVLLNLTSNALDALEPGGQLVLAAERGEDGSPGLRVADTGRGISPEVLPKIFEPYFTTKRPGEGTGLGLATALRIVRQSGGQIHVESALGAGTTFLVTLPAP